MLEIGKHIKKLREEKRITGKNLAQRIGLSQSQMSRLEKGLRRIDTEVLARIAEALGVSPARFFVEAGGRDADPLTPQRERELSISHLHVELGKIIRSERRRRHLTVDDLARKTNHARAYVTAIEEGRRSGTEGKFLKKACRVLAIDPFAVIQGQERIILELKTRVHHLDRAAAETMAKAGDDASPGGTPILVGDESVYPAEFDRDGNPVAAVEGFLFLPDLHGRPTFALRVHGDEMTGSKSPALREGDLVVFSTDRSARSGECAFVRYRKQCTTFRRIFHDEGPAYRLQALRDEVPPILLSLEELISAWPLVASLCLSEA